MAQEAVTVELKGIKDDTESKLLKFRYIVRYSGAEVHIELPASKPLHERELKEQTARHTLIEFAGVLQEWAELTAESVSPFRCQI
jgi:hypothetical protein